MITTQPTRRTSRNASMERITQATYQQYRERSLRAISAAMDALPDGDALTARQQAILRGLYLAWGWSQDR